MLWWMETRMMPKQSFLMEVAPCGSLTRYDQSHLALYAALLDAEAAGQPWQEVASTLMRLDPEHDGVERCWHSHLERARWVRSEEHTSELQSLMRISYAVFCLKKKTKVNN